MLIVTIHIFSSTYFIYIISQGTKFHYGTISTDSGCMSVSNHFLNSFDALANCSAWTPGGVLARGSACPCGLTGWQGQRRWVASGLRRPLCSLVPGTSMVRDPVYKQKLKLLIYFWMSLSFGHSVLKGPIQPASVLFVCLAPDGEASLPGSL